MDLEKLQRDIKQSYNKDLNNIDDRISNLSSHINQEWEIDPNKLSLHEVKTIATTIVDIETLSLHDEVESLLAQKEKIERALAKKSQELQNSKYIVFDALEAQLDASDKEALAKLHQVKLQFIDLFDLLGEMVESAIITTVEKEKDGDIQATTSEVIKELTFQAIKEGTLNTIRVRKILSTILQSSMDVAEAIPNSSEVILRATLKGMRAGLIRAIDRFKQRLVYMPVEAKHILIEDYDTIIEDLNQTDTLFAQVVETQAIKIGGSTQTTLLKISKEMKYDLEELVHISKETAEVMRSRFSNLAKTAVQRSGQALNSETAKEAKRMGIQALGVAKNALGSALKTAKDALEKKGN